LKREKDVIEYIDELLKKWIRKTKNEFKK
jgi:hypothetical protein